VLARARGSQSTRDLLGALVEAMGSGVLAEDELVATATLLLAAGHETTTGLIGNAVVRLAGDPAAVTAWRERPGIGASAVEELLRLDGPVQLTARTTLAPISVDGVEIPAGVDVIVLLGAANRDHRVFPGPDRLDLERSPNPQLAFGFGLHHCLGAPLARLEAEVALYELVARLGRLELARAPERRPGVVLRGMRSVWLRPPAQVVRQPAQAARW
jgi:cytochrome P450